MLVLDRAAGALLRERLDRAGFAFRTVPHAVFSCAGGGVVATLYRSGKLVLQGSELDLFVQQHLPEAPATVRASADDDRIGSDEAGKGDFFGSLVVASAYVAAKDGPRLRRIGVTDSKQLSDETIARIAGALESTVAHRVVSLAPEEYNRRWEETRNVNVLLGQLHAEAILGLSEEVSCRSALIDRFGDVAHVTRAMSEERSAWTLEARPRAESHVAVAAASILARDRFVRDLRQLGDDHGLDLPKGAGDPVDAAARRFVTLHGRAALRQVAKVHFKTTQKVTGLRWDDA